MVPNTLDVPCVGSDLGNAGPSATLRLEPSHLLPASDCVVIPPDRGAAWLLGVSDMVNPTQAKDAAVAWARSRGLGGAQVRGGTVNISAESADARGRSPVGQMAALEQLSSYWTIVSAYAAHQ